MLSLFISFDSFLLTQQMSTEALRFKRQSVRRDMEMENLRPTDEVGPNTLETSAVRAIMNDSWPAHRLVNEPSVHELDRLRRPTEEQETSQAGQDVNQMNRKQQGQSVNRSSRLSTRKLTQELASDRGATSPTFLILYQQHTHLWTQKMFCRKTLNHTEPSGS